MTTRGLLNQFEAPLPLLAYLRFFLAGTFFGIILLKSEVVSWYRIQEMFRFQSFHMYGVIGSAVLVAFITIWLIKRFNVKTLSGEEITFPPKPKMFRANFLGGSLFGLGWAMTGACPGPIMALIGAGFSGFVIVLLSAVLGTYVYGRVRHLLPH